MKKILFILLVLLSTLGFSQNPNWSGYTNDYGSHKFKFYSTRAHYTSLDTVWTPTSQKTGDVWWDNSKKTLSIQTSNTMVRKLITDDSISYYIKQPIATSVDNSLLKTVGTSGRAVEQTGVTVSDGNIVSAPTFSATNLTDGYIPYHISDALGQGNSVIYNNAASSIVGINCPSGGSVLHIAATGAGSEKLVMSLSSRNDIYARRWDFTIGYATSTNYELRITQQAAQFKGDLVLQPGRNTRIESNVGIGCTSPTSKLSVLGTTATNNNLFNFVHDTNKVRTTFANATDTSSIHASYTSTGNPEFHITSKGGATQFKSDSASTTFLGTYSGIYVADASTAQAIATGTTYTKSTAFTTNGSSSNCTADAANDKITVTKTGHYLVNCPVSFSGESPNVNWKMAAFLGGVEQPQVHVQRNIGTGGDVGSTTCTGIINVTSVPVDVDIRFRHDQAGNENITVVYSNLTVTYIGE